MGMLRNCDGGVKGGLRICVRIRNYELRIMNWAWVYLAEGNQENGERKRILSRGLRGLPQFIGIPASQGVAGCLCCAGVSTNQ